MSHPAILPVGIPMEFDVLGLSLKETKVAGRIVQLIAIKVMDFFARFNMAFDETSHYKNMFKNIPFFISEWVRVGNNFAITLMGNFKTSLPSVVSGSNRIDRAISEPLFDFQIVKSGQFGAYRMRLISNDDALTGLFKSFWFHFVALKRAYTRAEFFRAARERTNFLTADLTRRATHMLNCMCWIV